MIILILEHVTIVIEYADANFLFVGDVIKPIFVMIVEN
jgi:hypothetical protein